MGCRSRKGKKQLFGPFKTKGNICCSSHCSVVSVFTVQSPITSCSRRDHSVWHASTNSIIIKIYGRRRWATKGTVVLHSMEDVCHLWLPCLVLCLGLNECQTHRRLTLQARRWPAVYSCWCRTLSENTELNWMSKLPAAVKPAVLAKIAAFPLFCDTLRVTAHG